MKIPSFLEKWWKPAQDEEVVREPAPVEVPVEVTTAEPLNRVEQRLAQLRAERLRETNGQDEGRG